MFSSPNLGLKFSRERPIRRALTKVLPVNAVVKGYRGTWGETGVSWDSLNIKMRSLPLDVLSYVLTQLGFRRTCAARIAKITQAVCDVTT